MTGDKERPKDTSTSRIARTTFQLLLMDLPLIGWLFIPVFAWMDHRREKLEKEAGN
jgi:hypothetical protein